MNEISIWDKLNTIRMIVLLEEVPFSNKYNQILFDGKQYAAVSKFIYDTVSVASDEHKQTCNNPNCNGKSIESGTETIKLPDLLHIKLDNKND